MTFLDESGPPRPAHNADADSGLDHNEILMSLSNVNHVVISEQSLLVHAINNSEYLCVCALQFTVVCL